MKAYITICDAQENTGSMTAECEYDYSDNLTMITYDESIEGFEDDCVTSLKIEKGGPVTLNRTGKYKSEMIFEKNKRHVGCYFTPHGDLMIGIDTYNLEYNLDKTGGEINIRYNVDCNSDPVSLNDLKISVKVRGNQNVAAC